MYIDGISRISEAVSYIEKLDWWLVPVRGKGTQPKAPMFAGWTDYRPDASSIQAILEFNGDAGIGLNLGGSGLVDIEADSPEGEEVLDELCRGFEFPVYQSKKSKHRLFQASAGLEYLQDKSLKIEFRAGRHQSVLPPSILGDERIEYRWIISPWDCPPPTLPTTLYDFYNELKADSGNQVIKAPSRSCKQEFPYRDRLDYILRKHDLLDDVVKAGLRLAWGKADRNGNVPCYVPGGLRGGNEDKSPSGVFNSRNGVLRDFSTGKNHLFFQVMAALTGKGWKELLIYYEAQANTVEGRPHSRRISVPTDAITVERRVPLETARAGLLDYYNEQLSRSIAPGTLHIITGPPGVGKTFGICQKLVEKHRNAVILTLENKLASTHSQLLQGFGGNARRMPILRETHCPQPDDYEAMSRRGFQASQSYPCQQCPIGTTHCHYLLGFSELEQAAQLCCAAIYHTHDDFYNSHGNQNRDIVVFDENCIDLLLEPIQHRVAQWKSWLELAKSSGKFDVAPFQALVDWLQNVEKDFLPLVNPDGKQTKYKVYNLPPELHDRFITKLDSLNTWLSRQADKKEHRHVQNLYDAALYLITQSNCSVVLERYSQPDQEDFAFIRFRKKNPLPMDKEVFVLDATASESLLRAVAHEWDIRVWNCPPIEQAGTVIQIMDYDTSRKHIRKAVSRHTPTNSAWLVKVIDAILEKHGPCPIITFKSVVDAKTDFDLLGKLKHADKISKKYNFPCRGHTFDDTALLVVGTPYKDEAAIWELALAIWGTDGLPKSAYSHRSHENGYFVANNMGYREEHLKSIEEFVVSADLVQAIGRIRPLQNPVTVYVISNAPIAGWDVQQYCASELFDIRKVLRRDSADSYAQYVEAAFHLLQTTPSVSNHIICTSIGMPDRTGSNYWKSLLVDHKGRFDVHNGRIRRLESPILVIT